MGKEQAHRRANVAVGKAIEAGQLERPSSCGLCGFVPIESTAIQAHHTDYRKPLDVEWLCIPCHEGEHRELRRRGEAIPF